MSARLHVFMIAGALQCYVLLLFRMQVKSNTEQFSCWSFTAMYIICVLYLVVARALFKLILMCMHAQMSPCFCSGFEIN